MLSTRALWVMAVIVLAGAGSSGRGQTPRRIKVIAARFSYTPDVIQLKKNEPVILVLRSVDVTHGLAVPELNIKTEIKKAKETEIALTPRTTGQFTGKCAYFCGQGHATMTLQIDVTE